MDLGSGRALHDVMAMCVSASIVVLPLAFICLAFTFVVDVMFTLSACGCSFFCHCKDICLVVAPRHLDSVCNSFVQCDSSADNRSVPASLIAAGHVDRLQQLCARESHKAP